jgi:hypothetical protein
VRRLGGTYGGSLTALSVSFWLPAGKGQHKAAFGPPVGGLLCAWAVLLRRLRFESGDALLQSLGCLVMRSQSGWIVKNIILVMALSRHRQKLLNHA